MRPFPPKPARDVAPGSTRTGRLDLRRLAADGSRRLWRRRCPRHLRRFYRYAAVDGRHDVAGESEEGGKADARELFAGEDEREVLGFRVLGGEGRDEDADPDEPARFVVGGPRLFV